MQRYAIDGWNLAKSNPVGNEDYDVWADLDGSNALETRYLRGDNVDQLLGRVDVGGSSAGYWTLTDSLGSVRDVVNNSGTVKDSLEYDAFGNIDTTTELDADYRGRYAYTGRELDVETGLQYNRARYYDSTTGRWVSQDPMGFDAGDSNLYRYVSNAPMIALDPSGLQQTGGSNAKGIKDATVTADGMKVGVLEVLPGEDGGLRGIKATFTSSINASFKSAAQKFLNDGDHFNWYQVATGDMDPLYFPGKDGKNQQCSKTAYVDPPPNGYNDKKGTPIIAMDVLPWYWNDGKLGNAKSTGVNPRNAGATATMQDFPKATDPNNSIVFKTWLVAVNKSGASETWQQDQNKGWSWAGIGFEWTWSAKKGITSIMLLQGNPPDALSPKTLFAPLLP